MKFIVQLIISTLAVLISDYFLSGVEILPNSYFKTLIADFQTYGINISFVNSSFFTAFIVAAVLSFLNSVVKPIMVLLTIPITFLTLGFFLLVINALLILLAAKLVDGFHVDGFWSALLFSFILSIVTSILENIKKRDEQRGVN